MNGGIALAASARSPFYNPALLHGVKALTADPGQPSSAFTPTSQTLYLTKLAATDLLSFSSVSWVQSSAGATITAGQNFISIYSSSGAGLVTGIGIDAELLLASQFIPFVSLGTTITIAKDDFCWIGWQARATTMPGVLRTLPLTNYAANAFLAAAAFRAATNGTGLTAAPASIVPGSNTTSGLIPIFAVL